MSDTTHWHIQPVTIAAERWQRWHEAAHELGEAAIGLRLELHDAARDPTRHMLQRAARAARAAERQLTGREAMIANATATELEEAATCPA